MKPFWKKPGKKKSKSKPNSTKHPSQPKSRPEPWKPPAKVDVNRARPETIKKAASSRKSEPKKIVLERNQDAKQAFLKAFRELTYRHSPWQVWSDFVTMFACAISNGVDKGNFDERERRYLHIINQYNRKERDLFPELSAHTVLALEDNPDQDFLGAMYMELGLSNERGGQFFTPYHICRFMSAIAEEDLVEQVQQKGYITINDSCCGSGAMLIAGANEAREKLEKAGLNFQNHVLVVGQDIDFTVVAMAYIQLSLLGIAGYFKFGNALTEPIAEGDSYENYWFTPIYFTGPWAYRRLFRQVDLLFEQERDEKNEI